MKSLNLDLYNDPEFTEATEELYRDDEQKEPVVLYMRYSSDNQTENSIRSQRAALRTYCITRNLYIMNEYVDRARTGRNANRDAFQTLIEDAKKNPPWKKVLVFMFNRYFRNSAEAQHYDDLLSGYGVKVVSITQDTDDTPIGKMLRRLFYVLDEYQSDIIATHTYNGMLSTASKGTHCGGIPPLGYDVDANKKLVINAVEADLVRKIFAMTDLGYSYQRMAKYLNESGYHTKVGKPFTKNSFDNILHQEKYVGIYKWNQTQKRKSNDTRNSHEHKPLEEQIRIEDGCPAIVDKALFERVQKRLSSRAGGEGSSKASHHYMLGGLKILKCAECGSYLVGTSRKSHGKPYTTYACPKHKTHECSLKEIDGEQLEHIVAGYLIKELYHRKDWKQIKTALSQDAAVDVLVYRRQGIDRAVSNIMKAISECYTKELAEKLRALSEEKRILDQQIKTAQVAAQTIKTADVRELCKSFAKHLKKSEDPETKIYLKEAIREITVSNDELKIELNIV